MKRILVFVCMVLFLGSFVFAEYAQAARFVNNNDGTVTDTQTGLMWADHDNGLSVNWYNAWGYCDVYSGGGKSGWRMPSVPELQELYSSGAYGTVIKRTGIAVWSWETRRIHAYDEAARFDFIDGTHQWVIKSDTRFNRSLPVRSGN